jgi:hypothetical protein
MYNYCNAQVPSTKETIQGFIDSLGRSNDRSSTTTSLLPAFTDGSNFKWKIKMWYNHKNELLWVEHTLPDSIQTAFIYCLDTLVFVSEATLVYDSAANEERPRFRNIYFNQSKIIDDSAPGRNDRAVSYYLDESKMYLKLFKSR